MTTQGYNTAHQVKATFGRKSFFQILISLNTLSYNMLYIKRTGEEKLIR